MSAVVRCKGRCAVAWLVGGFSSLLLIWGLWPAPTTQREIVLQMGEEGASPERIVVEWPTWTRAGEKARLKVHLSTEGHAQSDGSPSRQVERWRVQARLELPGASYSPAGQVNQTFSPTMGVHLTWQVNLPRPGEYEGVLWLYAQSLEGDQERSLLAAPRLRLSGRSLLGVNGPWARALGSIGLTLGLVFGLGEQAFSFFCSLWSRVRRADGRECP